VSTPQKSPTDTILLAGKTTSGKDIVLKAIVSGSEKPRPIHVKTSVIRDTAATLPLKVTADSSAKPAAAVLADFFHALEQQPQQFVIDTRADTIIAGNNGTTLLIPANSFTASGHVTITLKEFYTYEDIITNKLTTQSGEAQLITGGMVHVVATVDGKEVNIQPGKSIRWFVPDTSAAMTQMQLFNGVVQKTQGTLVADMDAKTLSLRLPSDLSVNPDRVDWIPEGQYFSNNWLQTTVKVLDLVNEPYKTRSTAKGVVGYFTISDNPKLGKNELAAELKKKYDYHKVRIKRKRQTFFSRLMPFKSKIYYVSEDVGDSIWISAEMARIYKLPASDTMTTTRIGFRYVNGFKNKTQFADINLNALAKRFSVDIRQLGWINCDRFYGSGRNLNYYVDIGDSAVNYYTVLVFDKIRSMMRGTISGNRVVFYNIPQGISAKVICIGIQNGKTVAAIKALPEYGTLVNDLKFEETSPKEFKEGISSIYQ
jgi:hypothetical protein